MAVFGALFHQFAIFGGAAPVLDLSDESLENYEELGEFDLTDIAEVSSPPLPSLKLNEMQPLIQGFFRVRRITPTLFCWGTS